MPSATAEALSSAYVKDNHLHEYSLVSTIFLSLWSLSYFGLDNFFKFENKMDPPSLFDQGKFRSGKAYILSCLAIPKLTSLDDVMGKVLDSPAVVHMVHLTNGASYTFDIATQHNFEHLPS